MSPQKFAKEEDVQRLTMEVVRMNEEFRKMQVLLMHIINENDTLKKENELLR